MSESPKAVFEQELPPKLKEKGEGVTKVNAIYQFDITGDTGGKWWVDCTKAGGEIGAGDNAGA